MNVLFSLWTASLGGAENQIRSLCRELREEHGVDGRILILTMDGPMRAQMQADGTRVYMLGARSGPDAVRRSGGLRSVLDGFEPDVVVQAGYSLENVVFDRAAVCKRRIVVEHGGLLLNRTTVGLRHWAMAHAARRVFAAEMRTEIAVSHFMYDIQHRLAHAPQLVCIPHGIDVDAFSTDVPPASTARAGRLRVVAAGRLVDYKGFDTLVAALRALRSAGSLGVEALIAGEGPENEPLRRLASRADVGGVVQLCGPVGDMPRFWRQGDVAVVPSRCAESFGLSALEAQACGLPVIATSRGALPEVVVAGVTGTIIPPDDPNALAAALRRYLEDPELVRRQGRAAHLRASRMYSLTRSAARYHALLAGVVGDPA